MQGLENFEELSIYVHVPFCKSFCRYCDFYSVKPNPILILDYLNCICKEYAIRSSQYEISQNCIKTLFFGGGTPSLIPLENWELLFEQPFWPRATDKEITVELNPESTTKELLEQLRSHGVNRFSLGVQSLNKKELSLLGRIHTPEKALDLLSYMANNGFDNVSVDIMYGIPIQTVESLTNSLETVIKFPCVKHLSLYELSISDSTSFGRHKNILPFPNETVLDKLTLTIQNIVIEYGFEQYEVSNFAKPGFRCKHNSVYWDHKPYIGLGTAASSYMHPLRWTNIADVNEYKNRIYQKKTAEEYIEKIDKRQLGLEMVMLGLRRSDGIDSKKYSMLTNEDLFSTQRSNTIYDFIEKGFLFYDEPFLKPTRKGIWYADWIASEITKD